MTTFSDFIVYADESGSPTLDGVDPTFPVFVLAMMLVRKSDYAQTIVPSVQQLKFDAVGHDQLILHERDIRRQKDNFAFLQVSKAVRDDFMQRIEQIVTAAPMSIYAAVIEKNKLIARYSTPWSPYEIALMFLMERVLNRLIAEGQAGSLVHVVFECRGKLMFLMERVLNRLIAEGQAGSLVHVVFECRGKKEDQELELEFRRIAANQANWGYKSPNFKQLDWEPLFVDKKSNSSGLQLADLVARPLGLHRINRAQPNQAVTAIWPKIPPNGLKWFP